MGRKSLRKVPGIRRAHSINSRPRQFETHDIHDIHDMDRKSFTSSQGNTFSYIHIPSQPTLLLLHGFPSHIPDWTHQIEHFASQGYGILACDLLGAGQSSKPTDAAAYKLKSTSDELAELLDALRLPNVIGVGHDVGATLLSRMATYHADRFSALVFLAVGPPKLGTPFDLDMINNMTRQALGFELLGYINWLSEDAQATLEQNDESAMSLVFAADPGAWREWFHPLHRMKEFVSSDKRVAIGDWYSDTLQREHLDAFGRAGGYTCTKWYRMWRDNLFLADEKGFEDSKLSQPVLFVAGPGAEQQQQMLAEWAPNMTSKTVNAAHWVHLQAAAETNAAMEQFISSLES